MVLAVLLGWAVALLNRRAQHKSLVTVVGTLLFLAVYYAAFCWVSNAVEALAVDAVQAGATAGRVAAPLRLLGLAAVGNVPALLLFLALAAACMALCGKALAKPYLRLLTFEPGRAKAEYRAKAQKKQPPRRALLRRELLHLGACPMWLLNCALSSLLLPVLGVAALWKAADLRAFTAAYLPESLPMLVCGMVCAIAAMNFITAPSVSLEGGTLWLLQSLPVPPQQVLRAKAELQLLLTLPGAWFCAGCAMAALRIPAGQGLLVMVVLAAFVWLTAQLGLALGLCLPNLHWVSEAAVVVTDDMISHTVFAPAPAKAAWAARISARQSAVREWVSMMPPATFTSLPMCPTRRRLVNPSRTQQSIASPTKLEMKTTGAPFRWKCPEMNCPP